MSSRVTQRVGREGVEERERESRRERAVTNVGVVHAVPGVVGSFHVAVVVSRVTGEAGVDENGVELVVNGLPLPNKHISLQAILIYLSSYTEPVVAYWLEK